MFVKSILGDLAQMSLIRHVSMVGNVDEFVCVPDVFDSSGLASRSDPPFVEMVVSASEKEIRLDKTGVFAEQTIAPFLMIPSRHDRDVPVAR